jgi:hypothetical protein
MVKYIIIFLTIFITQLGFSHEGHDEPKQMPSPKGGITRMNEKYFLEYVFKAGGGTIYLYDHNSIPASVAGIEATATFEIPRKPNITAKIIPADNYWIIESTLPKTHRITLKLKIKDKSHSNTFAFVVEPK